MVSLAGNQEDMRKAGSYLWVRRLSLLDKARAVHSTLWNLKLGGSLHPKLPVGQDSNVPSHFTALLLLCSALQFSRKCISDEVLEQNQKCWSWAKTPNKDQQWENAHLMTAAWGAIFKYCQWIRNSPPNTLNSLNFKNWVINFTILENIIYIWQKKEKEGRKEKQRWDCNIITIIFLWGSRTDSKSRQKTHLRKKKVLHPHTCLLLCKNTYLISYILIKSWPVTKSQNILQQLALLVHMKHWFHAYRLLAFWVWGGEEGMIHIILQ